MLSARAYSFAYKSRLAISLSWVGGYTNVVALLSCGTFVSHVTGTTTMIGKSLVEHDLTTAFYTGFLWFTFLAGAAASAVMTEGARRRGMASKYILPIAVEAGLLCCFAWGIQLHPDVRSQGLPVLCCLSGLASFAMGLQNATITRISGAVVRTTHLTGVTTDLVLEGVQFLYWCRDSLRGRRWARAGRVLKASRRHPGFLRVLLLASIIASFLLGALVGTFAFAYVKGIAFVAPVGFLLWIIYVDWRTPIADVREIDLLADPELKLLGIVKSLLPPGLGIWRVSCRRRHAWHRAPDFQVWAERIPYNWRVIILAVSPMTRFDRNALMDLEQTVRKLRGDGRKLILSGVTQSQYLKMYSAGIGKLIESEDLCSDLEFAIARGIDVIQALIEDDTRVATKLQSAQ